MARPPVQQRAPPVAPFRFLTRWFRLDCRDLFQPFPFAARDACHDPAVEGSRVADHLGQRWIAEAQPTDRFDTIRLVVQRRRLFVQLRGGVDVRGSLGAGEPENSVRFEPRLSGVVRHGADPGQDTLRLFPLCVLHRQIGEAEQYGDLPLEVACLLTPGQNHAICTPGPVGEPRAAFDFGDLEQRSGLRFGIVESADDAAQGRACALAVDVADLGAEFLGHHLPAESILHVGHGAQNAAFSEAISEAPCGLAATLVDLARLFRAPVYLELQPQIEKRVDLLQSLQPPSIALVDPGARVADTVHARRAYLIRFKSQGGIAPHGRPAFRVNTIETPGSSRHWGGAEEEFSYGTHRRGRPRNPRHEQEDHSWLWYERFAGTHVLQSWNTR